MGNLDRLLEALARKLPAAADRTVALAALRAAGDELPESQAKTRARLKKTEAKCADRLLELLRQAERPPEPEEVEEEAAGDVAADAASSLYRGVTEGDSRACLARCEELLRSSLCGLQPAKEAAEALDGLLALLWPGLGRTEAARSQAPLFDLDALRACARLGPLAAAAFADDEGHRDALPAWRRLVALLLAAPCRARKIVGDKELSQASCALGGVASLCASPATARAALRIGLEQAGAKTSARQLAGAASAAIPVVRIAFGAGSLDAVSANAADLAAVLQTARFVGLCRIAEVGEASMLDEACGMLGSALEHSIDASAVLPHLAGLLPDDDATTKKLVKGAGSRAAGASLVVRTVSAAAAGLPAAGLARISSCAGLPAGDLGGGADQRAAAARARGDLFFEDVEGAGLGFAVDGDGDEEEADGIGAENAAEAAKTMRKGSLVQLEGVENIDGEDDADARKRRPRGKRKVAEVSSVEEAAPEADAVTPAKRRLSRKKKPADTPAA